jgi:hypothetical protein
MSSNLRISRIKSAEKTSDGVTEGRGKLPERIYFRNLTVFTKNC